MLTPAMWEALDGDTQLAALKEAPALLPAVLEVQTSGGTRVVVDCDQWKAKIKASQRTKEEDSDDKDVG